MLVGAKHAGDKTSIESIAELNGRTPKQAAWVTILDAIAQQHRSAFSIQLLTARPYCKSLGSMASKAAETGVSCQAIDLVFKNPIEVLE